MAIDDRAFLARRTKATPSEIARLAIEAGGLHKEELSKFFTVWRVDDPQQTDFVAALEDGRLAWNCASEDQDRLRLVAYTCWSYLEKVSRSLRSAELPDSAYDRIWNDVNDHLCTFAHSLTELVEQLGIMRFGHRPKVADTFCGAGSIPFEAARLGCDVYASDLNPIACMLTWGALHLVGGGDRLKARLEAAQKRVAEAVDRRITDLGIEHDKSGNRAKAYLYCLETRCPVTGWLVPLLPSLIISKIRKTVARLVPNPTQKRIDIDVVSNVSPEELEAAKKGTFQGGALVYAIGAETFRTPISSIRGDFRSATGATANKLRRWSNSDVVPQKEDIFGERLYCIQWITQETLAKGRPQTFFASPTDADRKREEQVIGIAQENLALWQVDGLVPDMEIEPGDKTDEPIRTRGWSHWHHLFTPRQLLIGALVAAEIAKEDNEEVRGCLSFDRTFLANFSSRLSQWLPGSPGIPGRAAAADQVKGTFYNQALNTFYNFGCRAWAMCGIGDDQSYSIIM